MPAPERTIGTALFEPAGLRVAETAAARALGDSFELMRRAGQAAWRELLARWPSAQRILVICGPGNNGGDGYVLAMHARQSGRDVCAVAWPKAEPGTELAKQARTAYIDAGGESRIFETSLPDADLVVDALFGIGLNRAPDPAVSRLIETINAHGAPVFSLDVPSGLDADHGVAPGACVSASHTLEFISPKAGLRTGDALDRCGTLSLAALDVDAVAVGARPAAFEVGRGVLAHLLTPRARNSHKGRNGRVLCIGGAAGMGGAIVLCAEAALRTGAGLVEVATHPAHSTGLLVRLPEAMTRDGHDIEGLADGLKAADCVAIGPGLGRSAWARSVLDAALAANRSLVVDADALNLMAEARRTLPPDTIVTPHPGEAARLLGITTEQVQADRFSVVRALGVHLGCVVVLKGAGTLVTAPDREVMLIRAGNPGMAVGGMGDVLTGVIASLRAQGLPAYEAAICGALLHSVAGDDAAVEGERGLLPSDLMPWLRRHANPERAA